MKTIGEQLREERLLREAERLRVWVAAFVTATALLAGLVMGWAVARGGL